MKDLSIKSLTDLIKPIKNARNIYHAVDVNMAYSFDSLKKLIEEDRNIVLGDGDIFICDSSNGRSRKALLRVKKGWLILYYRLDKVNEMKVEKIES